MTQLPLSRRALATLMAGLIVAGCQGAQPPPAPINAGPMADVSGSSASVSTPSATRLPPTSAMMDVSNVSTGVVAAAGIEPIDPSSTKTVRMVPAQELPSDVGSEVLPSPAPRPELLHDAPNLAEGDGISLDEALQQAVATNPTLQQAYYMLQQAQGNFVQVGLLPNPKFEWHSEANNAPFDAHFGLVSQELVTGKKLQRNRDVASFDIRRAQWEVDAQNLRVLNDVRIRFNIALGAQRRVAVVEELLEIAENGVRTSEQLFQGEEVSEADVLQARLQMNETQVLLRNAHFEYAAAWRQLVNMMGRPDLPPRTLVGQLDEDPPPLDWDTAWTGVVSRNPLIHAARARMAAAEAQVRREQVEPLPNLELAGYAGIDALRAFNPTAQNFPMFMASMGAKLPLYDRNQGNIIAARAQLDASRAEVSRLELSLRDQMASTFQRYQTAVNQVQVYRVTILPLAERNLALAMKAYEQGELDFLRVLTARRELFNANINYVSALVESGNAGAESEGLLLTGGLAPLQSTATPANSAGQTSGPGN